MNARVFTLLVLCLSTTLACRNAQDSTRPLDSPAASTTTTGSSSAVGLAGFETLNIALYQPDSVLEARVSSTNELAAYIKRVQATCQGYFGNASPPEVLDVVIAIKPARRSRVWLVSPTRAVDDESLGRLRKQIESIPPIELRGGPIAFAIMASIGGASRNLEGPTGYRPPLPKEWTDATLPSRERAVVPDDVLRVIWPDP